MIITVLYCILLIQWSMILMLVHITAHHNTTSVINMRQLNTITLIHIKQQQVLIAQVCQRDFKIKVHLMNDSMYETSDGCFQFGSLLLIIDHWINVLFYLYWCISQQLLHHRLPRVLEVAPDSKSVSFYFTPQLVLLLVLLLVLVLVLDVRLPVVKGQRWTSLWHHNVQ